jgi:phosphatidylglycerol---prolipoprotein diacylglyceryl transferase
MASSKKKPGQRGNAAARSARPRPAGGTGPAGSVQDSHGSTLPSGLSSAKTAGKQVSADKPAVISRPAGAEPEVSVPAGLRRPARPGTLTSAAGQGGPAGPAPARAPSRAAVTPSRSTAKTTAAPKPVPAADENKDLPPWAAKVLEEMLVLTYWIDPGDEGEPFNATIRFTGRRNDVSGRATVDDSFAQDETVTGIVPGSGPVAITTEIRDINAGEWSVSAQPVHRSGSPRVEPHGADGHGVPWPRRVLVPERLPDTVHTARLTRSKVPGVIRYAYATLVTLGILVGFAVEALLLRAGHYSTFGPLMYSLAAIAAGAVGGKLWYVAVQGGKKFDGWCIQGFVGGAAVVIGIAALAGPGVPAGVMLAAGGPALLIGMGVGRPACFWAGCCTGKPTAKRWGVWSSDRRLGCRREPAQLTEAVTALIIGVAVLVVVLVAGLERSGPVAVAGLAAYTVARQFIIGMRAEPRRWKYGRVVTGTIAALVLIASLIIFALS